MTYYHGTYHGSSEHDSSTILIIAVGVAIVGLILLLLVCSCTWCSDTRAFTRNENIREAGLPSGSPRLGAPMIFDPATRKARVLRALVEHEVTVADLLRLQKSPQCVSSSIDSIQQFSLGILSCVNGGILHDFEVPPINVEQVEQVDPVTIDKYLRDWPVEIETSTMQPSSTLNAKNNHSTVDGNILSFGECTICMEEYANGDMVCWGQNLSCKHAFHTDCVLPWLMCHDICPNCRSVYLGSDLLLEA